MMIGNLHPGHQIDYFVNIIIFRWTGRVHSRTGIFPANFVEVI